MTILINKSEIIYLSYSLLHRGIAEIINVRPIDAHNCFTINGRSLILTLKGIIKYNILSSVVSPNSVWVCAGPIDTTKH